METGMILELESTVMLQNSDGRVPWVKIMCLTSLADESMMANRKQVRI